MFNRKPYPYKEGVVNVHCIYYAKDLAVIQSNTSLDLKRAKTLMNFGKC